MTRADMQAALEAEGLTCTTSGMAIVGTGHVCNRHQLDSCISIGTRKGFTAAEMASAVRAMAEGDGAAWLAMVNGADE